MSRITVDHVAIMVSDLERSLAFYRDILGMEVVSPEEHDGGPIDEMTAMSNVHMREYRLRPPGGVNGHTRTSEQGFRSDRVDSSREPERKASDPSCAQRALLFWGRRCAGDV